MDCRAGVVAIERRMGVSGCSAGTGFARRAENHTADAAPNPTRAHGVRGSNGPLRRRTFGSRLVRLDGKCFLHGASALCFFCNDAGETLEPSQMRILRRVFARAEQGASAPASHTISMSVNVGERFAQRFHCTDSSDDPAAQFVPRCVALSRGADCRRDLVPGGACGAPAPCGSRGGPAARSVWVTAPRSRRRRYVVESCVRRTSFGMKNVLPSKREKR